MLELPDGAEHEVPLELEDRKVLGAPSHPPELVPGRIALAEPQHRPLRSAEVPASLRPFLDSCPDSAFWLVGLGCTLLHDENAPMETAWVQIRLEGSPGTPTAHAMEPLLLYENKEIRRQIEFGAGLTLGISGNTLKVGPQAGVERETVHEERMVFLEALAEGTSRPSWLFTRTEAVEIRGHHRLRMIVEVPRDTRCTGTVSAGATLHYRRFGIFSYLARLDGTTPGRFELGFR